MLPEEGSRDALARFSVSLSLEVAGSGAEFPQGHSEDRGFASLGIVWAELIPLSKQSAVPGGNCTAS